MKFLKLRNRFHDKHIENSIEKKWRGQIYCTIVFLMQFVYTFPLLINVWQYNLTTLHKKMQKNELKKILRAKCPKFVNTLTA